VKRVLVVMAIVVVAIAAWVFLRTGSTPPPQTAGAPPSQAAPTRVAEPAPAPAPAPAVVAEPAAPAAPVRASPTASPAPAPAPTRADAPRRRSAVPERPAPQAPAPAVAAAPRPAAPPPARRESAAAASAAAIAAAEAALGDEVPDAPGHSGAIAGIVADALGARIPGATILAVAPDGSDGTETFADDDGEFVLPGLRPGRYAVFAGLGTPLASRVGGRSVKVGSAAVTRVELREPSNAAPVRVAAVDEAGQPVVGEAILIASRPAEAGAFGSLLASDAIFFPEARGRRSDLRVPPGTYTVVMLQGAGTPARAAPEPIQVTGAPLDVNVQLGALR
jgi:hypothetical protein